MKKVNVDSNHATVELSRDELLILNSALNEICYGIELFEFDTRIGSARENVIELLHDIGKAIDVIDAKI